MKVKARETAGQIDPDEYLQRRMEREAALWWRFNYDGERPPFMPMSTKLLRAESEKQWVSQMWLGQLALEQGSFSVAEEYFREALVEVEKLEHRSHSATTLRCLARTLCLQGKHEEAEPLYRQTVELHGQAMCLTNVELEEDYDAFVTHYRLQGKYREAEQLISTVLDEFEKSEKNAHIIAKYLNNLAVLMCEEGRCEEAEAIYKRVLDLAKTFTGERLIVYAIALLNLAVLCFKNQRIGEAHELYEHATEILRLLPGSECRTKLVDDYSSMFDKDRQPRSVSGQVSTYLHAQIPSEDAG